MRKFAEVWPDEEFVQQAAAQIPWFHNCVLLDMLTDLFERVWYIRKAFELGWSRDILVMQIESRLFNRQGKAVNNFAATLPPLQSDLAEQTLKDPYVFDFLGLGDDAQEREIERELVKHITNFLLELGAGFSFVGKQVSLEVEGEDFFIDLLFYHLKLRCYVVIELKATKFKPEYAGKLNFYLSAVDATMRHESDNPSIGLILCKDRKGLIAEYALKDISKPVGVSEYQLVASIPENLRGSLPTIEELEAEFADKV
jgi:predicted nuclease of restriction endonuclease-like (RecB) superfamily